jgi:hypothetical protein
VRWGGGGGVFACVAVEGRLVDDNRVVADTVEVMKVEDM